LGPFWIIFVIKYCFSGSLGPVIVYSNSLLFAIEVLVRPCMDCGYADIQAIWDVLCSLSCKEAHSVLLREEGA